MSYLEEFEKSPFGPLTMHLNKVKECVSLVKPMFEAVAAGDFQELESLADKIFKLEHEADEIKNEIRRVIPKAFSLPVYRGDLLNYLKLQDDMADAVEDLAVVLTIKHLSLHQDLVEPVTEYVESVLTVCELLFECSTHLADLTEYDFRDAKGQSLLEQAAKAEHAEWKADKSEYSLAKKLFALEDHIKATDILLWSNAFQQLGKLANHADKTAERLRLMLNR